MSKLLNNFDFKSFAIFSVIFHLALLLLPLSFLREFNFDPFKNKEPSKFKIHSLRTVGLETGAEEKSIFFEQKEVSKKRSPLKQASQLAPSFSTEEMKQVEVKDSTPTRNGLLPKKAIKSLSLNKKSIQSFLKNTPNEQSASQFLKAMQDTDTLVKLEVPKGVKEDELNKHELVFYSFQKRTALNYINSFYKKLNEFELKNPHLHFPLTDKKEKMIGRVVYDKNGNIIKINMLQWSNVEKLQDFFLDVLKEMTALPNPPDQIIQDEQFTVFYALTING